MPTSQNVVKNESLVSPEDRLKILGQKGLTVWLTGLSGSGKSTISNLLEQTLVRQGKLCCVLDGDNIRQGLSRDLGFSAEDRRENIRRVAEVAALMTNAGVIVITAFISPYIADRWAARHTIGDDAFVEVFINTALEVCEERDPKGLYRKARAGHIPMFTGISAPYEVPPNPDIKIDTVCLSPQEAIKLISEYLFERGLI